MNAANNTDGTTMPEPRDLPELPELSDERIDEIEAALFDRIADERTSRRERSSRRRRATWLSGAAAAAVLVVAVAIAPTISGVVGGVNESAGSPDAPQVAPGGSTDESGGGKGESTVTGGDVDVADGGAASEESGREIIATASATVRVDDIPAAAEQIGAAAVAAGGYVESMSVGGTTTDMSGAEDGVVSDDYIDPYYPTNGGWITVRVPADELTDVIAGLSQVGQIEASEISRQDVTMQAVDLRARIDAAQVSVDRLTALLAEAEDVSDLIAAESALAERQATLEAYQSELEYLESQVAMSSLSVSLLPYTETVEADPAGFTDGLQAGWNGLVTTLNGIVIALGFLIPWILVIAVIGLIVWGIVRLVRGRRSRAKADAATPFERDPAGASPDGDDG